MDASEAALICLLSRCTFLPRTWDKRFVRSLFTQLQDNPTRPLSEKQKVCLRKLVYKYRRQLSGGRCAINPVYKLAIEVQDWCAFWCYTDPFIHDGQWWAYPPAGVMPVPVDWMYIR